MVILIVKVVYIMLYLHRKTIKDIVKFTHQRKMKSYNIKKFLKCRKIIKYISKIEIINKKYTLECLNQSLVLFYLSKDYGIEVEFKMGMNHLGRFLKGHAWLEYEGHVFDDEINILDYKIIYSVKNTKEEGQ